MVSSYGVNRMSAAATQAIFWVYSGLMGLSISTIFLVYTYQSIARVFFASLRRHLTSDEHLYGYTTKSSDLTQWGSFLWIGLIGVVIASLVNLFVRVERAAIHDLGDRGHRLCRPHRVGHPAD